MAMGDDREHTPGDQGDDHANPLLTAYRASCDLTRTLEGLLAREQNPETREHWLAALEHNAVAEDKIVEALARRGRADAPGDGAPD